MNADIKQARKAIRRCRELRQAGKAEAVLRSEFHSRLRLIFPDSNDQNWINHYGEGTEAKTRVGLTEDAVANRFIDNLVGYTTIEYESDLRNNSKRERGFEQVREHVAGLVRNRVHVTQVRGILSDTIEWLAYDADLATGKNPGTCTAEDISLELVDELNLKSDDVSSAKQLIGFIRKHLAREQSRPLRASHPTHLGCPQQQMRA